MVVMPTFPAPYLITGHPQFIFAIIEIAFDPVVLCLQKVALQKLLLTAKKKKARLSERRATAFSRQQLTAISMQLDKWCKEGLSGYPETKGVVYDSCA